MPIDFVSVLDDLVIYLRANLQDLRTDRESEWIYPDYPRADAQKPRLAINISGIQGRKELGFGMVGQSLSLNFEVDVYTDSKFSWTNPNDDREYSGGLLREYLASKVVSLFRNDRVTLADDFGWKDVKLVNHAPFPYDEDNDLNRETLTFLVEFDQEE